jgi:hypothetical protein
LQELPQPPLVSFPSSFHQSLKKKTRDDLKNFSANKKLELLV